MFQGNETNKENMHLKITGFVLRNLTQSIQNIDKKQIKLISNHILILQIFDKNSSSFLYILNFQWFFYGVIFKK